MSVIKANEIQDLNGNVILNTNNRIKFLQVVSVETTQEVQSNVFQSYYDLATSVSLTTVGENSSFFIIGYTGSAGAVGTICRVNLGFSVTNGSTTTRISGVDSSLGDSWGSNAAISATGVTLNRSTLWTPNTQINSNVTLTFNLLGGAYDTTSGTVFWNRAPYSHNTTITVMEFAA